MRKYLYLWIKKFIRPDSNDEVLFENFGVSLSSEYDVQIADKVTDGDDGTDTLSFTIKRNESYLQNFFGMNVNDLKVFAGKNGSGKTSLFKIMCAVLSKNTAYDELQNLEYVLIFMEDGELRFAKSVRQKIDVQGDFPKKELQDGCSDCMIYYTAAFNAPLQMLENSDHFFDISTDYLVENSVAELGVVGSVERIDKLTAYSLVEMDRNIRFVTDYIEDVKDWISLPKFLKVSIEKNCVIYLINKICVRINDNINDWLGYYDKLDFENKILFLAAVARLANYDNHDDEYDISRVKALGSRRILDKFGLLDVVNEMLSAGFESIEKSNYLFDVKNNHKKLLIFKKAYNEIVVHSAPFLEMKWRGLSSGEEAMIKFFGRFYHALYECSLERGQTIHLIIDEADLYLHPEWQRIWLKKMIDIVGLMLDRYPHKRMKDDLCEMDIGNPEDLNVQVFIASHSPFILSDIPRKNCVLLSQNDDGKSIATDSVSFRTFGANIYDIVKNEFFMNETMGELAKAKINDCLTDMNKILDDKSRIKMLQSRCCRIDERTRKSERDFQKEKNWNEEIRELEDDLSTRRKDFLQKRDEYKKLISTIDEPIIKNKMSHMFDEVTESSDNLELKAVQEYIAVLQEKESRLKEISRG